MYKQYFSGKQLHLSSEEKRSIGGYKRKSLKLLTEKNILVGDNILIKTDEGEFTGILMPRYESADENHIVVKLKSGYNIGIETTNIQSIVKIMPSPNQNISSIHQIKSPSYKHAVISVRKSVDNKKHESYESLPKVALISTGGTIASKIDYRTGGVHAAISATDLYASIPELGKYASVDPEVILNEYSENLKPEHWTLIANKIAEKIRSDRYRGIIISHGTDTMHYTASALSFALQNLPVPVVLVGAQRSSDRPSSDAALNLIGATVFCIKSDYSGVFVAMHAGPSDDIIACHMGTRVRKNHTSRRDAFESIDMTPVALVRNNAVEMQKSQIKLVKRSDGNLAAMTKFDDRVALLKYHPGFDAKLIEHAAKACRAIILEGT